MNTSTGQKNRWWYVLLAALILVVGVLLFYYGYYIRTPKYAVMDAADAAREHNLTRFERRVDIDTLVQDGFDDVFRDSANAGTSMSASLMYAMRPIFIQALSHALRSQVEQKNSAPIISIPLVTNEKDAPPSNYEVTDIQTLTSEDTNAEVLVRLREINRDRYIPLHLLLVKDSTGFWRIKRLQNATEVYDAYRQISGATLLPAAPAPEK